MNIMRFILILITFTVLPVFSLFAQSGAGPGGTNPSNPGPGPGGTNPSNPGPGPGGINPAGTTGCDGTGVILCNPLGDKDIIEFLQDILDVIMVFAVPLIIFMIIYAGFLFVMDRGNNKNLEQAKRALLYAVIGGVIILGARVILEVVQGTVDAFR
jgi:hypothetical protein